MGPNLHLLPGAGGVPILHAGLEPVVTRRQEAPVLPAKYLISNRTVEPHPAVHWMANPDPDPALKNVLKITYKEFSAVI